MKVLAVEDDPVAQLVLEAALKSLGHEAVLARDGESAWQTLNRDAALRVIVSDWRMPGVDGLELCRRVRGRRGDYVSFILLTQLSATEENVDAALEAGVDDFLTKPVDVRELKIRLHAAKRLIGLTSELRQLEAILPICGYCKKIRDDQNYWQQLESYIHTHTGTAFSHGVCPDCHQRHVVPMLRAAGINPEGPNPPGPPSASRVK
jgi:DNA-binding response OmpR family regulator